MQQDDNTRELLANSVAAFLSSKEKLGSLRLNRRSAEDEDHLASEMAELGWLGVCLPEQLVGLGLTLEHASIFSEMFGEKAFSNWLSDASIVPSVLIAACPRSAVLSEVAGAMNAGTALSAFAWQETAGQIDEVIRSTKIQQGKLSGRKVFVPETYRTANVFVLAMEDSTPVIALVPSSAAGLSRSSKCLSDGSTISTLDLVQVCARGEEVVARGDDAKRAASLAIMSGTLLRAGQLFGLARGALRQTVTYLHDRTQFGQSLSSFQVLQHRVVDLHTQVRIAEASWRNAIRKYDVDPLSRSTRAAVSAAKARASDVALLVCKSAVQMHGAIGFTDDAEIGRYLKCALAWSASYGNAARHRSRFLELSREV